MPSDRRRFGDLGEEQAAQYLKNKGYEIFDRNWRKKGGEIDIVAGRCGGIFKNKLKELVFVEVKTILDEGLPNQTALAAKNVHFWKQQRLIRTAKIYLAEKRVPALTPWRIDVVLVVLEQSGRGAKIEHLENAVWGK